MGSKRVYKWESRKLQKRWLEAMNRITCSLISEDGVTARQALIVCDGFRKSLPLRPTLKRVLLLEAEAKNKPPIPEYIRTALENEKPLIEATASTLVIPPILQAVSPVKPRLRQKRKKALPSIEDYPEPWCKVTKDGKLIRYEDSTGRIVPKIFWPSRTAKQKQIKQRQDYILNKYEEG